MEIQKIFNTTKEEIESKKFNIFIAVCLGNKFFLNKNSINKENIKKYLDLAFGNTKEKVIFLIADKIQVTNFFVRNKHSSREYSLRRVFRDGAKIKKELQEFVKTLPKEKQNKIKIIQWEDYEKEDIFCKDTAKIVYEKFNNNPKFRKYIFDTIKTTMTDRPFKEKQYWEMCNYILDEFSLVYSGLVYENDYYGLFFYPQMDSTAYFIEDIKNSKIFPELNKKLPKEKVALAIVN